MGTKICSNKWFIWAIVFVVVACVGLWVFIQCSIIELDSETTQNNTVLSPKKSISTPPISCDDLDKSTEEVEEATMSAMDELFSEGKTNPWGDPVQFEELLSLVEKKLGCSLAKDGLPSLNQ